MNYLGMSQPTVHRALCLQPAAKNNNEAAVRHQAECVVTNCTLYDITRGQIMKPRAYHRLCKSGDFFIVHSVNIRLIVVMSSACVHNAGPLKPPLRLYVPPDFPPLLFQRCLLPFSCLSCLSFAVDEGGKKGHFWLWQTPRRTRRLNPPHPRCLRRSCAALKSSAFDRSINNTGGLKHTHCFLFAVEE